MTRGGEDESARLEYDAREAAGGDDELIFEDGDAVPTFGDEHGDDGGGRGWCRQA